VSEYPPRPDYVLVGHITADLIARAPGAPGEACRSARQDAATQAVPRAGGTALYAAVAASRLGRRVGVVTSCGPDAPPSSLPDEVAVIRVESSHGTIFEIDDGPLGRSLRLLDRGAELRLDDVPETWRSAPIVHLAPVIGEVSPSIASGLSSACLAATPQGWLRAAAIGQAVRPLAGAVAWPDLHGFAAVVLSVEDLGAGHLDSAFELPAPLASLARGGPTIALTDGPRGCLVIEEGQIHRIAAPVVAEVDSTGAGDVFAAAFFVRFTETRDPTESARFASCAAALSVTGHGTSAVPGRAAVVAMRAASGL